jgi:hypothetical protein
MKLFESSRVGFLREKQEIIKDREAKRKMKPILSKEFILEALENHMAEILNEIREDARAGSGKERNELLQFTQQLGRDKDFNEMLDAELAAQKMGAKTEAVDTAFGREMKAENEAFDMETFKRFKEVDKALSEQFREVDEYGKTISINSDDLKPKLDQEMEKILEGIAIRENDKMLYEAWKNQDGSTTIHTVDKDSAIDISEDHLMPNNPPKWQPSGGSWFLHANGDVREMSPNNCPLWWQNEMDEALGAGRLFETEQQTVIAGKLQRAFMRFVKWCFENEPDITEKHFNGFIWLLKADSELWVKLKKALRDEEVEF